VTLRGTCERFSQRRAAAERAAKGVHEVINHLKVNVLGADSRSDDEIRGAALQSLIWDAPSCRIRSTWRSETGGWRWRDRVSQQYQSDAASNDVSSLYAVHGVTNEIVVQNFWAYRRRSYSDDLRRVSIYRHPGAEPPTGALKGATAAAIGR
jgi:osmotically-inducible protein OsmY